ncbi:MAG: hypothetical protein ACD_26C00065G0003 [uncultured bacterium]|nr:MAG: hypothetical protein ACD_26C00065G0003 [uncultured bacterium]
MIKIVDERELNLISGGSNDSLSTTKNIAKFSLLYDGHDVNRALFLCISLKGLSSISYNERTYQCADIRSLFYGNGKIDSSVCERLGGDDFVQDLFIQFRILCISTVDVIQDQCRTGYPWIKIR